MTGTATLLGWMDPAPPAAAADAEHLARATDAMVRSTRMPSAGRWHEIEIVADNGPIMPDGLLAAQRGPQPPYHFLVDPRGRAEASDAWRRQTVVDGPAGRIRIAVARTRPGQPMSPAQIGTVRAIIASLDAAASPAQDLLPVRLDPAWTTSTLPPSASPLTP